MSQEEKVSSKVSLDKIKELVPSAEQLLDVGAHFGHQTRRWNPKMSKFIYKKENKAHLIDLIKTHECLLDACSFLAEQAALGKTIVLVGTKRQASGIISSKATAAALPYIDRRWLGGFLTNFDNIKQVLTRLNTLESDLNGGKYNHYTKKERLDLEREILNLKVKVGGVRFLNKPPDVLVIIDPRREKTAVREALRCRVPVVALVDTNSDPTQVLYPIPGNDDAISSIKLIVSSLIGSILLGAGKTIKEIEEINNAVEIIDPKVTEELPVVEKKAAVQALSEDEATPKKASLESLGLSTRAVNALNKAGYKTVSKIAGLSEEDLNQIKGLGEKTIKEILSAVKKIK